MNRLDLGFFYFKFSLNPLKFSPIRETDSQMLTNYNLLINLYKNSHLALGNLTKLMIRLIFFVSCDRKSERIERIFKTHNPNLVPTSYLDLVVPSY